MRIVVIPSGVGIYVAVRGGQFDANAEVGGLIQLDDLFEVPRVRVGGLRVQGPIQVEDEGLAFEEDVEKQDDLGQDRE